LPAIFGLVETVCPYADWSDIRFADGFLGAGSVSLAAKALGFAEVLANDIAQRSAMLGRALVANSTHRITHLNALRLFEQAPAGDTPLIAEHLPEPAATFAIDTFRHFHGGTFEDVDRDLIGTLLMGILLRCFPMGLPAASDATHVAAGDYDRLTGSRLAHYLRTAMRLTTPRSVMQAADLINMAITPGRATVSQADVFVWLPQIDAEVIYVDPPYGRTQAYETAFRLIDEFLRSTPLPSSSFSTATPPLDELLDACNHIPTLVMSMGNAVFNEHELTALVARHRHIERVLSIPYRHFGSVATATKNTANRELLVLATKGRNA